MAKLKVEQGTTLKGEHEGEIIEVNYRDAPYKYTDVIMTTNKKENFSFKAGFPTNLVKGGALHTFVSKFKEIKEGDEVDIDEILIGQKVSYLVTPVVSKKDSSKTFHEVVKDSIEPLKE